MTASAHPNVELVRRLYDAMAARDLETILEIFDPEVEIRQSDQLPWGGEFHGYDGLGEFFRRLSEHIDSKVSHDIVFAAGDRVVQVGRTAGHVKATGTTFDIHEMHLLTIRARKVIRFEAHIDTPAMLAALGSAPSRA
jgi:ketosteroid isomerase-like protein